MPPRRTATRTAARPSQDNDGDEPMVDVKPAVKRVTKTKKATAKKPVADEDNSDEEDNVVPEITFNADEFKSRPLNKAHGATRLSGAAKDWEGNCKPLFAKKAFPMMVEVASNAVDLAENDEDAEAILKKLDPVVRQMLDLEAEVNSQVSILKDMHSKLNQGEEFEDAVDTWEKEGKLLLEARAKQTSRQKYAKDKSYINFRQAIWEARRIKEPMPPLVNLIPKETGDESSDDEEIQVGGLTQDYKCPLTLLNLTNPLTSNVCKHSFNNEAITEYLRGSRGKKCPATGCDKILTLASLEPDEELLRKAKAHFKRIEKLQEQTAQATEELSDDDDEIDD